MVPLNVTGWLRKKEGYYNGKKSWYLCGCANII